MRVLIVTRNSTDGKNHNVILYVVVHYIIIKYLYENVIWFFILVMFISLYILFTEGVMFILFEYELVPKCIQQHKILIEKLQLVLHQRKESIYHTMIIVSNKVFLIVGIEYPIPYYDDIIIHIS